MKRGSKKVAVAANTQDLRKWCGTGGFEPPTLNMTAKQPTGPTEDLAPTTESHKASKALPKSPAKQTPETPVRGKKPPPPVLQLASSPKKVPSTPPKTKETAPLPSPKKVPSTPPTKKETTPLPSPKKIDIPKAGPAKTPATLRGKKSIVPAPELQTATSKVLELGPASPPKNKETTPLPSPNTTGPKPATPRGKKSVVPTTPESKSIEKNPSALTTPTPQSDRTAQSTSPQEDTTIRPTKRTRDVSFLGPRDNAPTSPGTKEIPRGHPSCLEGLTFIVTGRLECLGRDESLDYIKSHGGLIRTGVTGKLSYLVVGQEPGESKMEKATQLGTKCISEDELFALVKQRSVGKVMPYPEPVEIVIVGEPTGPSAPRPAIPREDLEEVQCIDEPLWCDKYRPMKLSDMCQPVVANKLNKWIQDYESKANPELKKAVLLSGPPGIGKTTSVHVVAAEHKYDLIEFNASDTRSATTLREQLSDTITNQSIFMKKGKKIMVLIDEVDGCDRGGVTELIKLIKKSRVPIVCTCNDRWHQKLRSFINHVEDLRVAKTPSNAMTTYIQSILHKEGVSIPPTALQDIISSSGNDFRSVLNNVQMWVRFRKSFDYAKAKSMAASSHKDEDVGLFQSAEAFILQPNMTISAMKNMFFANDLMPLFVQENYIHFRPDGVPLAAHMIALGDVIGRKIMSDQRWELSNAHFLTSSLYPTQLCRGQYNSFAVSGPAQHFDKSRPVKFPTWLGQNSTATKYRNCVYAITAEGAMRCGGTVAALEYFPVLREALTVPLRTMEKAEGVKSVMSVMDRYRLRRDDWDAILEISGVNGRLPVPEIATAVKSAFTREFNKTHQLTTVSRGLKREEEDEVAPDEEGDLLDGEDGENKASTAAVQQKEKEKPTAKKRKK